MGVHLIKLAVGVEDVEHLAHLQAARMVQNIANGLPPNPRHITRMMPKRQSELLDGGSIYWVIKGAIRARQRLVGFDSFVDEEGVRRCAIVLDPDLVSTQPRAHRAFQGWRYLTPDKAPQDLKDHGDEDLPADLARDLDELGLL